MAITNVTVIDMTGAPARPGMTVVVSGEYVTGLGRTDSVAIPTSAVIVDGTGRFLIPGLWDMHVHLDDPEIWHLHPTSAEKELQFPLLIANGVTGVRDMGGGLEQVLRWRAQIEAGLRPGPKIFVGPLVDGPPPQWQGSIIASTAAEGREAVRALDRRGMDFIKVYQRLPRDVFLAIAEEARRRGLPFAGHVPSRVGAAEASDAGQRSMEHLFGLHLATSSREEEFQRFIDSVFALGRGPGRAVTLLTSGADPRLWASHDTAKAAALFARFVRNGTYQTPTMRAFWGYANVTDSAVLRDPRLRYAPRFLRDYWAAQRAAATGPGAERRLGELRAAWPHAMALIGRMHRAGVPMLVGTDLGAQPYNFPGFAIHEEIALLVEAGMPPMAALQAATVNAARFLGVLDSFGTVEWGKVADLVLLDADPLADIRNTSRIRAVVLRGHLYGRTELDAMLRAATAVAAAPGSGGARKAPAR